MHCSLQRKYNVNQCTDFPLGSDGLVPRITFWSEKWSCFRVSVTVRFRALFLSSTTGASTKGG